LGRVTAKTQTVGSGTSAITKSVGYTYTNGGLTSLVTPSGQTVTYGYNNGQVISIAVNGNPLLSQALYQPFGPVSGWTWANNTNEARVYDEDGNVTNVEAAEGFPYGYDSAFRITGITDTDNSALSQSYGYDALDRLTGATGTGLNESWTYDANGNPLTQGGGRRRPTRWHRTAISSRASAERSPARMPMPLLDKPPVMAETPSRTWTRAASARCRTAAALPVMS
jgi:YD repeat-containing protein